MGLLARLAGLFASPSPIEAHDEAARAFGATRSKDWPRVRDAFLRANPACRVCRVKLELEVHHKTPVHVDQSLELSPSNMMTLCRRCHLFVGHLGSWLSWNDRVDADADYWCEKFAARPKKV